MNGEERKRRFVAHWFAIKIPTHFPVASQNLAWDKESNLKWARYNLL